MKEQVLSIKQMQELKELGIDITSASMKWAPKVRWNENGEKREVYGHILDINYTPVGAPFWETVDGKDTIPTFTLQDILEIIKKKVLEKDLSLDLELNLINNQFQLTKEVDYRLYTSDGKTLLQSAFQMLKWCKQNNYI